MFDWNERLQNIYQFYDLIPTQFKYGSILSDRLTLVLEVGQLP
jgi:hypothetical protein